MDDPQSSNPLEPILDAGSEVFGNAIGALIDPFGSDAAEDSSADDESTHEAQAVEVDVAADVPDDADDSDNDIDYDDEGYDDGNESRYTAAASSAVPIEAPRNYRESILPKSLGAGNKRSRSTAFSSDFSPG